MKKEPSYCHHKATDQAYVRLGGKVFYLGKYNSVESQELYKRLKSEWLLNKHVSKFHSLSSGPTIAELALAYLDHAEVYYGSGTETG
jgi:hypothetical protein